MQVILCCEIATRLLIVKLFTAQKVNMRLLASLSIPLPFPVYCVILSFKSVIVEKCHEVTFYGPPQFAHRLWNVDVFNDQKL